jgi:hypothetical protein
MGLHQGTAAGAHRTPIGFNLVFSDILDLFLSEGLRCSGHLHFSLFPLSIHFRFFNDDNDPSFACHNYHIQARLAYSVARLPFSSSAWFFRISVVGDCFLFFNFASASRMQDMFWVPFLAIGHRSPMGANRLCHATFCSPYWARYSFLSSSANFSGMGTGIRMILRYQDN